MTPRHILGPARGPPSGTRKAAFPTIAFPAAKDTTMTSPPPPAGPARGPPPLTFFIIPSGEQQ